jgi:geranylgeranyl reductase family protein
VERCDVLIIGGGPAGSSCARQLQRAGSDVVVWDKRTFPRDKTCAGWVTPQVLETLQVDQADYRQSRVLQPITGFRTGLMGWPEVHTQYDRVVSYGIRRCEFDHYLLERTGATLRLGEAVARCERSSRGWVVNGEIETSLLIGAGGHFCPVARMLGCREDRTKSVVAAQEVEFEVDPDVLERGTVRAEEPELFFCADLNGYAWCFRKGNFLNIGLGRLAAHDLSQHVHAFCEFLKSSGKVACEMPKRMHGHAYQLYERTPPRLVDEHVLLIGDAAGLAYPQSGEGIRPAVESGLIAAEVIVSADGDYSAQELTAYANRLTERLGAPRKDSPSGWLPASWLHYLAGTLMSTRWFNRRYVIEEWFLHARQPALELSPVQAQHALPA